MVNIVLSFPRSLSISYKAFLETMCQQSKSFNPSQLMKSNKQVSSTATHLTFTRQTEEAEQLSSSQTANKLQIVCQRKGSTNWYSSASATGQGLFCLLTNFEKTNLWQLSDAPDGQRIRTSIPSSSWERRRAMHALGAEGNGGRASSCPLLQTTFYQRPRLSSDTYT